MSFCFLDAISCDGINARRSRAETRTLSRESRVALSMHWNSSPNKFAKARCVERCVSRLARLHPNLPSNTFAMRRAVKQSCRMDSRGPSIRLSIFVDASRLASARRASSCEAYCLNVCFKCAHLAALAITVGRRALPTINICSDLVQRKYL